MKVFIKSDELIDHDYGYVSRVNKTLNSNSQNMSVFIEVDGDKFFNGMYVSIKSSMESLGRDSTLSIFIFCFILEEDFFSRIVFISYGDVEVFRKKDMVFFVRFIFD